MKDWELVIRHGNKYSAMEVPKQIIQREDAHIIHQTKNIWSLTL